MANSSIYNAFERMWQHTNDAINSAGHVKAEEVPNLYVWEKLKAEHATAYEVVKTDVTNVRIGYKLSYKDEWDEVRYADSYELQGDTIALINPTTVNLDQSNRSVVLGKYIYYNGSYYEIPSTANLSSHSGTIYKEILVDNAKQLIVNSITDTQEAKLGYVSSKYFNTYPTNGEHTDGYWYKYIKQMGDSAVVDGSSVAFTETDPTVPAWAKEANKPTYTASEVGALPNTTKIPSKTSDLTNDSGYITSVPVTSVNGKTGAVQLSASDVGALPSTTQIPTKVSDLTNDSKFATETYVDNKLSDVNGILIDPTLSIEGRAADAKAVGDALANLDGYATQEYVDNAIENLEIPEGGTVTDEQIADAVHNYLQDNPIDVPDNVATQDDVDGIYDYVDECVEGLPTQEDIDNAVNGITFEQKQADYNQNNSNASDYIKNRTHYTEYKKEYIAQDVTFTKNSNVMGFDWITYLNVENLKKVYVIFDGVEYVCPVKVVVDIHDGMDESYFSIGSTFGSNVNPEYPFGLFGYKGNDFTLVYADEGEHTISVYYDGEEVVHKLDNKYINAEWMATKEVNGGNTVYIAEQTISGSIWSKLQADLQPGIIYDVIINDKVYVCECSTADDGIILGNDTSMTLNDYPFCIFWLGSGATSGMFFNDDTLTHPITLKVTDHVETVYNKLPVEYLPEIVTDEQIATAVTEYLKDNPITGGNLIITDDENGNVFIESVGSTTIVDDGLGNITIL